MKKNQKGISLITLVITIVVLGIIASISIYSGKEIIDKAKLEELRTNMLIIKGKAMKYVEEANFKIGFEPEGSSKIVEVRNQVYGEANLVSATANIPITPMGSLYEVPQSTLEEWGLGDINLETGEKYLIDFKDTNFDGTGIKVEVYNTLGYKYNGVVKYSLTDINEIEE